MPHHIAPELYEARKMRIQRKSEGFRYGTPNDHELGVQTVDEYLQERHYQTEIPFNQYYSDRYQRENPGCPEGWSYDLAAWKSGHILDENKPDLIVEVDGKKHDKILGRIKDGVAKKWIEETFPKCKFVRIRKEDCQYANWLRKKLGV
jgi:hypothetical protein